MSAYKIVYEKIDCIGAWECEAVPTESLKSKPASGLFDESVKTYNFLIDGILMAKQALAIGIPPWQENLVELGKQKKGVVK